MRDVDAGRRTIAVFPPGCSPAQIASKDNPGANRGDHFRLRVVKFRQVAGDAPKGVVGLLGFQIANVLADENICRRRRARRRFSNARRRPERLWIADSRFRGLQSCNGQRRVTARAAQHHFAAEHHADNRIIHMAGQSGGCEPEKHRRCRAAVRSASCSSVQIGSSLKLPLVATTGKPSSAMQQMMQRIGRQHHAEIGIAGRDGNLRFR